MGWREEEALNFGPRREASWSSFCGFGEGNVLVSTWERLPLGTPRGDRPGPHPGREEVESSGSSWGMSLLIYIERDGYAYLSIYIY